MTAPLIVGVPSTTHREALLRETAGGGRVPVMPVQAPTDPDCPNCDGTGEASGCACAGYFDALILSHPTDPEAGAMGLARLAWVAAMVTAGWRVDGSMAWRVQGSSLTRPHYVQLMDVQHHEYRRWSQNEDDPCRVDLRDATSAAHAIGLVCVHLGLLDRVEVVP